ncbi:MAG: aspartate 1-decarboxylase [Anaerolineae bacterium]
MIRTLLGGKIHRATVTDADLHYVGSITIDSTLIEAAGILPSERVQVVDIDNGARLETYVIPGPADSGTIQINGAAAHKVSVGDKVIIMSYVHLSDEESSVWQPRVVHVDACNNIVATHRGVATGVFEDDGVTITAMPC